MALVTCYDPEGNAHQKEPVDAREAVERCGFTMTAPGENSAAAPATDKLTLTVDASHIQGLRAEFEAKVEAARAELADREAQLRNDEQAVKDQAAANSAEADRLAALRTELDAETQRLAADKAAFEAAKSETPAAKPGKKP